MDSVRDILARQQRNTSTSSDGHQTDGLRSSDVGRSSDPVGMGGPSVRPSEEEVFRGWIAQCDYCGKTEPDHVCLVAWRWQVVVPDDPVVLGQYLFDVWGIRLAELVAWEVGADAIRDALVMVRRGAKEGRIYDQPAGLIVKLARRIKRASDRVARGR